MTELHAVPEPSEEQLSLLEDDPDADLEQTAEEPAPTTTTTGWRARSACNGLDPAIFFPEIEEGGDNHGAEAKAVCATCPVVETCLVDAIESGQDVGIWGGTGESLRRWLARAWRAGGETWTAALDAHLATLHGEHRPVVDRNGKGATHGLRSTYNRGCRCRACRASVALVFDRVEPLAGPAVAAGGDDAGVEWRPLSALLNPFDERTA